MKVGPAILRPPFISPGPVHGDPTASFAELLEGGAKVGALLSQRALGFAEAGLLGAHYSWSPGSGASIDRPGMRNLTPEGPPPQPDLEAGLPTLPRAAEAMPNDKSCSVRADAPPGEPRRGVAQPARSSLMPEPVGDVSPAPAEPLPAAETEDAGPGRPVFPDRRHTRRNSPFKVTALGAGTDLTIVIDGAEDSDGSVSNLEETARAIASDYAVQIGRVIVRTAYRGAKG